MFSPEFTLLRLLVVDFQARLQRAREDDSGASAIEWALITAGLVAIALIVGFAVTALVTRKAGDLNGL